MIRTEEAFLILGKWRDEQTSLHVIGFLSGARFGFDCRVMQFNSTGIIFDLSVETDVCEVFTSGFQFDYAEPKDIESAMVGERRYDSGLKCERNAERLFIMEIRK